jgi:hypothetical protein
VPLTGTQASAFNAGVLDHTFVLTWYIGLEERIEKDIFFQIVAEFNRSVKLDAAETRDE